MQDRHIEVIIYIFFGITTFYFKHFHPFLLYPFSIRLLIFGKKKSEKLLRNL